ncbi:tafazzin-like isoform X1 [Tubulanus polymorphus]|uniref:tafazzin-like isoform X1 n=1 Tax=Tubulanus polymorphus TaxID=672921 RepID=UPI003DA2C487
MLKLPYLNYYLTILTHDTMDNFNVTWQRPPARPGLLWKLSSALIIGSVSVMSKITLEWLNRFKVFNREIIHKAVLNRPKGQPLITVCNHVSCLDDPVMWGVLPWRMILFRSPSLRWSLAGHDICYTKNFHSLFFTLGNTVPIVRGNGVYQQSMDYVIDRMNQRGDWIHIFPEGKINLQHEFIRLKWGVGRLVAECKNNPIIIPIWHVGMDNFLPNKTPYIPRMGQKITMLVGKPLDLSEQLNSLRSMKKTSTEIRKHITDIIQDELQLLKVSAEKLHAERKS